MLSKFVDIGARSLERGTSTSLDQAWEAPLNSMSVSAQLGKREEVLQMAMESPVGLIHDPKCSPRTTSRPPNDDAVSVFDSIHVRHIVSRRFEGYFLVFKSPTEIESRQSDHS